MCLLSSTSSLQHWPAVSAFTRVIHGVIINPQPMPIITVSIPSFWLLLHRQQGLKELIQATESYDAADGWQPFFSTKIAIINHAMSPLTARRQNEHKWSRKHKLLFLSFSLSFCPCHWLLHCITIQCSECIEM